MASPPNQIAVPQTESDRLMLLEAVQVDLRQWVDNFRGAGLSVLGTQPEMAEFSFDAKQGCLTSHAKSGNCRVHLYLSGVYDGQAMIPTSVAEITGTCNEYRRRRMCLHTLTAINRLAAILSDKNHPLRKRLFRLNTEERWRESLKLVDQFLVTQSRQQADEAPPELRVVWRIEFQKQIMVSGAAKMSLDVVPCEQKIGKNGRWTKGRRLSLDALRPDDESLSDTDRRIASKLLQARASYRYGYSPFGYYGDSPLGSFDILQELVGHPLVFWDDRPEVPVEVVRGQFGIVVEETSEGWMVKPAFDGQVRPAEGLWSQTGTQFEKPVWVDRAGDRVVVCPTPTSLVTLVARLSSIPEPIPPAGQPTLLEKLALLQSQLPVVLPASCSGGSEAADGRLVLRLSPESGGALHAEMIVRPVAGGAVYSPGGGPASIAVLRDGKQFHFTRSLADERRRAGDIAEELRLAMFPSPRTLAWQIPTLDDALDLLARLADRRSTTSWCSGPKGASAPSAARSSQQRCACRSLRSAIGSAWTAPSTSTATRSNWPRSWRR